MGRRPAGYEPSPYLHRALRWLRDRANLSQEQVSERVVASGGKCSLSYYRQCERGERTPSHAMLTAVLDAVSSDHVELDGLLETRPWEGLRSPGAHRGGLVALQSHHDDAWAPPAQTPQPLTYASKGSFSAQNFAPSQTRGAIGANHLFGSPYGHARLAASFSLAPGDYGEGIGAAPDIAAMSSEHETAAVTETDVEIAATLGELRDISAHVSETAKRALAKRLRHDLTFAREADARRR
jgi:transcriptional regulator with XRE-family HTH domain